MSLKSWKRWLLACVVLACSGAFLACAPPQDPLPDVSEGDRKTAVKSHTLFALSLYKELQKDAKGNIFVSPYSISSALTMAYAGAKGDTATEMRKALQMDLDDQKLHPANAWLMLDMNNRGRQGRYQLSVANRVWGQKGYSFMQPFLDVLSQSYIAGMAELDISAGPDAARKQINDWVAQKTHDKIKDLMPAGSIKKSTRMVLTNAIYFKGDWLNAFKKENTQPGPFHVSKEQSKQANLMFNSKAEGRYGDFPELQILAIPYKGKELSLVVLLPKEIDGLSKIEDKLSREQLEEWMGKLADTKNIMLTLPKLEIEQKRELTPTMKALGMTSAFDDNIADFSGINGGKEAIAITNIFHQSYLKIDEEGTVAAAATGISFGPTSAPISVEFKVDRPFLLMIRDETTGSILFLGRITDPTLGK